MKRIKCAHHVLNKNLILNLILTFTFIRTSTYLQLSLQNFCLYRDEEKKIIKPRSIQFYILYIPNSNWTLFCSISSHAAFGSSVLRKKTNARKRHEILARTDSFRRVAIKPISFVREKRLMTNP